MRYVIADKTWIKALTLLLFSALSLIARAELVATTVYYHNDLAGSPVALTDAAGALLWTVDRYPYGEEYQPDTASVDERIGYTGHVLDRGTGLVYMQARYYDPLVGRFYGIDPKALVAENAVSVNRYAYSGNNPYTYTDPNGEWLETGWDVLNVTIGLASLSANVATGNYLGATLDAVGLVYDVGAMAVPGVPAGASYVIKGARLGDEAVELGGSFVASNTVQAGRKLGDLIPGQRGAIGESPPNLKRIHSDETITSGSSRFSHDYWSGQSTGDIVSSLKPGGKDALRTKSDGRIFDGNTRVKVLQDRKFDANSLPREVIK